MTLDPQFGPVLLFGSGGRLVEVYRDRALALPPLNTTLARRMMEQTRVFQALKGPRESLAADIGALRAGRRDCRVGDRRDRIPEGGAAENRADDGAGGDPVGVDELVGLAAAWDLANCQTLDADAVAPRAPLRQAAR